MPRIRVRGNPERRNPPVLARAPDPHPLPDGGVALRRSTPRAARSGRGALQFTPASYTKVRAALLEQDRLLRCGLVMDADTVLSKVRGLVRHSVRFKMPRGLFKPFAIPVSLEEEYTAGEFRIAARTQKPEIVVRPAYLRLGFNAELEVSNEELIRPGERRSPSSRRRRLLRLPGP